MSREFPPLRGRRPAIAGKRRFTCLSPTLVRMEFSPDGVFEERRSLVAYAPQQPAPFAHIEQQGDALLLDTGAMTLISRESDRAFFPANLEMRGGMTACCSTGGPATAITATWAGTVRSLDRFGDILTIRGRAPRGYGFARQRTRKPGWPGCSARTTRRITRRAPSSAPA